MRKHKFLSLDLNSRQMQWSFTREGPPPLSRDSSAYRFAGFGHHEWVVYYDLIRYLLAECWASIDDLKSIPAEAERLKQIMQTWMEGPEEDYCGRIPAAIIESERRRVPLVMSAKKTTLMTTVTHAE
jgi:hypothetical protein